MRGGRRGGGRRVMSRIRVMSKMRRFSLIALATAGILFFGLSSEAAAPDGQASRLQMRLQGRCLAPRER